MMEDLRLAARIIHLLFSLAAALVVYSLMLAIYSDRPMSRMRWCAVFSCSLGAALLMHSWLDIVVEVP